MIVKSSEINKIDKKIHQLILFHGKNEGLKNDILKFLFKDKNNIHNYDEEEVLDSKNNFVESVLTKSLFEENKSIIIKRVTDKILKTIEFLHLKELENTIIILDADILEKKSKIRSYFEKDKKLVSIPFYPDSNQILSKLAHNFLKEEKILISPSNIKLIIDKCSGDRKFLINELQKIKYFCKSGKEINNENILNLINLNQDYTISELVNNCLANNKKKIIDILNENNFNNEDCVKFIRFFIMKAKKLLILSKAFEANKNMELTILSAKPAIFWKEKEITKRQIREWKPENIKKLICILNKTELLIKKNINNSINLITDFILFRFSSEPNN